MSEEATAFARHDETPFPIVPDETPDSVDEVIPDQPGGEPQPGEHQDFDEGERRADDQADPILSATVAPDTRQFLRALIALAVTSPRHAASDDGALGIVLEHLGHALTENRDDEALTFQALVDALDRARLDQIALAHLTPVAGAFVARLIAGERRSSAMETDAEALQRLVATAQDLVGATLEVGGARAWRRLPRFAATIAERAAQRELPLGAVAEMLPRLGARFGLTRHEPAGDGTVVSITDDLRGDPPRGAAADEPRRMVISGPVEIVILNR